MDESNFKNTPLISFIYHSQSVDIEYSRFSKLSNYQKVLELPHQFKIIFPDDEKKEVVKSILAYIQNEEQIISKEYSFELFDQSQKLFLYKLSQFCQNFITENFSVENTILFVFNQYSNNKDISSFQHFFSKDITKYAQCKLFFEKLPLDFIINVFKLGSGSISPDDYFNYSIKFYRCKNYDIEALQIFQYIDINKVSGELLTKFKKILKSKDKPFPFYNLIKTALDNKYKVKKQEVNDIHVYHLKAKLKSLSLTLYHQVSQNDPTQACLLLSSMYESGNLPEATEEQIFKNFINIAESTGNPKAYQEVAERFEKGKGTPVNLKKAIEYYEKASDNGKNREPAIKLAHLISSSIGSMKPFDEFKLVADAAKQNDKNSLFTLANFYKIGHGCKKSNLRAIHYFILAGKAGCDDIDGIIKPLLSTENSQTEREAKRELEVSSEKSYQIQESNDFLFVDPLKLAADSDYVRAIVMYSKVLIQMRRYKEAKKYCKRLIDLDSREGYNITGTLLKSQGKFYKAFNLFNVSAGKFKYPQIYLELSVFFNNGWVVGKDLQVVDDLIQNSADLGDEKSQIQLAVKKSNYNLLSKLSKTSNCYAKYEYGKALLYGKIDGKPQIKPGLNLIREASEGGYSDASYLYGKFMYEGQYLPKDTLQSMNYLNRCRRRNVFYTTPKRSSEKKLKVYQIDNNKYCIDSFYCYPKENAMFFKTCSHGVVYTAYVLLRNFSVETYLLEGISLIKSMVYENHPSFRYKAGSILLNPQIFNNSNSNPYSNGIANQKIIDKIKNEAFNHLRQSSDAGSVCGMFRYAYYLLFEKDNVDDNNKNIFYNITNNDKKIEKKYYHEAMCLFLKAGLEGLDISLFFYAITALTFPEMAKEGLSYLKYLAFERNHSLSKTALGIYFYKKGNYKNAISYLKDNAYNKDRAAEYYYGRMLMNGEGIKEDRILALNFLRLSSDKGFKLAQVMLINLLIELRDQLQIRSFLEPRMYDNAFIMYKFSSLFFAHVFDDSFLSTEVAIDLLKTSSLLNDSDGLWKFGTFLRDGFMVAKNEEEAFELFQKSSNLGNSSGKVCYANYLVKTRPKRKLNFDGNDNGYLANFDLSNMEKNREMAFNLFKDSYDKQSISGAWCYANCLMRGIGCEVDQLKALSIFVYLSNEYKDIDAQYKVFKMLMNGVMIKRNSKTSAASKLQDIFGDSKTKSQASNESSKEESNNNNNNDNNNNNNNNENDDDDDDGSSNTKSSLNNVGDKANGCSGSCVFVRHQRKALEYLITAANNGHSTAQCRLGEFLLSGMYFKKDWKAAVHFFKLSAEKGNHRGINNYVTCLIEGNGGYQRDINTAVSFLEKLCVNHKTINGNSEFMYGSILIDKLNQIEEGKKYIMRSAIELGNSDGLWKLGDLFLNGIGYKKDVKTAMSYYKRSKEKGNKTGLFKLAELILLDYEKELTYMITKNATNNDNNNSGSIFLDEKAVDKIKEGLDLLEKAANLQQSDAQLRMAYLTFYGVKIKKSSNENFIFIKKDVESAIKKFKLIANRDNNPEAMFMYGKLTNDYNYISRSARLKNDKARIAYGKMVFNISSEQKESSKNSDENEVEQQKPTTSNVAVALSSSSSSSLEMPEKNEKLAVYYFKLIADSGNAEAQYLFAVCLMNGNGIEKDKSRAQKYFKLSAEQGFRDAQYEYGRSLIKPSVYAGNLKIRDEGIRQLKEASMKGNYDAMYKISIFEQNVQMLLEAAEKGSKKAIAKCASIFYEDSSIDMKIDKEKSFLFLQKAAEFDPKSAFYYGMCLRNGIKIQKDNRKAFYYIKKSYEGGFKQKAAALLGLYYLGNNEDSDNDSDFVEKNTNKAFLLFNESLDCNDFFGMSCFGYCFYKGIESTLSFANPNRNPDSSFTTSNNNDSNNSSSAMKNAVHFFKVANDNEDPSGINNYAVAMFQGNTEDGSPKLSISFFIKAAERGCSAAVVNLRKIYSPQCPYPSDLIPKIEDGKIDELEIKCNEAREKNIFCAELAIKI